MIRSGSGTCINTVSGSSTGLGSGFGDIVIKEV